MNRIIVAVLCFVLFGVADAYITHPHAHAETVLDASSYGAIRFNNENWHTLPHPTVLSFSVAEDGSASGITEDGRVFLQYNVPNTLNIRVQRFEIEDHYHYIVNGEIADTFDELSKLLATAYTESIAG